MPDFNGVENHTRPVPTSPDFEVLNLRASSRRLVYLDGNERRTRVRPGTAALACGSCLPRLSLFHFKETWKRVSVGGHFWNPRLQPHRRRVSRRPSTQCSPPLRASQLLSRALTASAERKWNVFNSPVYSLVIPAQEQTRSNCMWTRRMDLRAAERKTQVMIEMCLTLYMCTHTLFTVDAPAAFRSPIMRPFEFMTGWRPGRTERNVTPSSLHVCHTSLGFCCPWIAGRHRGSCGRAVRGRRGVSGSRRPFFRVQQNVNMNHEAKLGCASASCPLTMTRGLHVRSWSMFKRNSVGSGCSSVDHWHPAEMSRRAADRITWSLTISLKPWSD